MAYETEHDLVIESDDGVLSCDICDSGNAGVYKPWCKHIEECIRKHMDAKVFWQKRLGEKPEYPVISTSYHLPLPIIPSHRLWADVDVSTHDSQGAWRLSLNVPLSKETITVGITGPGEGRNAWRMMVLEYWRTQCAIKFPKCRSKGHSYKAQVLWTQALEQDTTHILYHVNAWTAWYHGVCYHCLQVRESSIDFDLIPDDPKATTRGGGIRYEDSDASGSVISGVSGGVVSVNNVPIGNAINWKVFPGDDREKDRY